MDRFDMEQLEWNVGMAEHTVRDAIRNEGRMVSLSFAYYFFVTPYPGCGLLWHQSCNCLINFT